MESRRHLRLLVVDEHREYFERIRDCAELCRHQFVVDCQFSRNADNATELMLSWQPGVVLVDAHLRQGNTLEFVHRCRDGQASIIVSSESASQDIEVSARRFGAQGYVSKSDDMEEIEALLNQMLALTPIDRWEQ